MHLVELRLLFCDDGHSFYIPNDEIRDLDDLVCPICTREISSEASRTVLMASSGRDTMKLYEEYGGDK